MSRGYVLVAANSHHYLELAVSAACSLRINDDKPIALLISGGIRVPRRYVELFDYIIAFDAPPPYNGDFLRRFVIEQYTPFEKVIHVDSDCLLIGANIGDFWDRFDGLSFGVMARARTTGTCYRDQLDVDKIVASGLAPCVYETNWGVFYYKNTGANEVMSRGRELIRKHFEGTTPLTYFSRAGQLSDEPIWGIALGQLGIDIPEFDYSNLFQVTSPSTSDHVFDYAGKTFSVTKGGIANVRGQFYHYAAMDPLDGYLRGVMHYRHLAGIELPTIRTATGRSLTGAQWAENLADFMGEFYERNQPAFAFVA